MSQIVVGISSGIAAYKTIGLIKLLKKDGHRIYVVMTKKSVNIISPDKIKKITGSNVYIDLFDKNFSYKQILQNKNIDHIEIARKADLYVVVPTTANVIAKLAAGIADDFMTTSLLATTAPVLICPSMNDKMWYHPATQRNLKTIQSFGYEILEPESGELACGTNAIGRLPDLKIIKKQIENILLRKKVLNGKRVLVTGGGTIEPIDSVRVITNRSSGKMGKALAEIAYRYGAKTTFFHAKNSIISHLPIEHIPFSTTDELNNLLNNKLNTFDIVFHAAAVSDFIVEKIKGKISSNGKHNLSLKPNIKIINNIKKINPNILLVAFKAIYGSSKKQIISESQKLITNAHADYIIVNDISRPDIGFETEENEIYIISKDKKVKKVDKTHKQKIAEKIFTYIMNYES